MRAQAEEKVMSTACVRFLWPSTHGDVMAVGVEYVRDHLSDKRIRMSFAYLEKYNIKAIILDRKKRATDQI